MVGVRVTEHPNLFSQHLSLLSSRGQSVSVLTWTFLSRSIRGSNGPTVPAALSSPFRQARVAA